MHETICTGKAIKHAGREISPAESIKELSTEYTRGGWVHHMEAQICGATLRFTLTSEERNKPAKWIPKELGPAAAGFDEKDSSILLAAIDEMSKPDWKPKVVPADGYYQEASGVYQDGFKITDFVVESAKRVETQTPSGANVASVESIGLPSRYIDLTTKRGNGPSKVSRITQADLGISNMAAVKIGGQVNDSLRFTAFLNRLLDKAA